MTHDQKCSTNSNDRVSDDTIQNKKMYTVMFTVLNHYFSTIQIFFLSITCNLHEILKKSKLRQFTFSQSGQANHPVLINDQLHDES